jgi:hypothetical protein
MTKEGCSAAATPVARARSLRRKTRRAIAARRRGTRAPRTAFAVFASATRSGRPSVASVRKTG